jgi:hypothetical protein
MTDATRPMKLVLDTSAILAFTRGSIHVGEPISEVADEGGVSGLPTLCLAVAKWMVDDDDRLQVLAEHPDTVVVPAPEDPVALGAVETSVGNLDASSAVLTAIDQHAFIITARPGLYRGLIDSGPIVEI